jgi:hypothetical protein
MRLGRATDRALFFVRDARSSPRRAAPRRALVFGGLRPPCSPWCSAASGRHALPSYYLVLGGLSASVVLRSSPLGLRRGASSVDFREAARDRKTGLSFFAMKIHGALGRPRIVASRLRCSQSEFVQSIAQWRSSSNDPGLFLPLARLFLRLATSPMCVGRGLLTSAPGAVCLHRPHNVHHWVIGSCNVGALRRRMSERQEG